MKLYETKLDPLGRFARKTVKKVWSEQLGEQRGRWSNKLDIYNERSGSGAPQRRRISIQPQTGDAGQALKEPEKRKEYFDALKLEIYKRYQYDKDVKNIGDLDFKESSRNERLTLSFKDPTLPPLPHAERVAWEERRGGKYGQIVRGD